MEELMKRFGFDAKISGKDPMAYMAELIEKNDKQEMDIERCKVDIGVLKQMNNRSKSLIDAARVSLKEMSMKFEQEHTA